MGWEQAVGGRTECGGSWWSVGCEMCGRIAPRPGSARTPWGANVLRRRCPLAATRGSSAMLSSSTYAHAAAVTPPSVVLLTALPLEYAAVRRHLRPTWRESLPSGTIFEVSQARFRPWQVVLALAGKGNRSAAVVTERAIARYAPRAVLFVGIAGSLFEGVRLGDVVVATQVHAVHGGREDPDGFKPHPRTWEPSHDLIQRAMQVTVDGRWVDLARSGRSAPSPVVHFQPIAAGEVVRNVREPGRIGAPHACYTDAAAVDMESAGLGQAAVLNASVAVLPIRGISDAARGEKDVTDRQGWQIIAAENAAAFALALVADVIMY